MRWRKFRGPPVGLLILFIVTPTGFAEIFSYRQGPEHFEVSVSAERLVVKERYQGTTTIYGDLSCPLGPAVRATPLPTSDGRLCFTFSRNQCEYTRFQDGSAIHGEELANARVPRMCIALSGMDEAQRLATLVNVGHQPLRAGASVNADQPESKATVTAPDRRAEPPNKTPHPEERAAQQASGSTQSTAERVQGYSSDRSDSGARADSARRHTPVGAPLALFVHVRNEKQRAQVERLIEPMFARGVRVTGIKLVDVGPLGNDLRYFYSDDAPHMGEVLRALRSVGLPLPRVKHIRGFEDRAIPRQYELWLSPQASP